MDNAIAVVKLGRKSTIKSTDENSAVAGFIPTGAYPSAQSLCLNSGYLYVCNLEASGARVPLAKQKYKEPVLYNSHSMLASVSVIRVPGNKALKAYTDTVIAVNNLSRATTGKRNTQGISSAKTGA
jgi:hypothetical protein